MKIENAIVNAGNRYGILNRAHSPALRAMRTEKTTGWNSM